ncbi:GSCOCG00006686001-RA-CDS [Cotesia congregata]|nr:GSCOCG00006686001-RA-CDS [Cotesia congregata]
MAAVGLKHCNNNGNIHALKVHSSLNGATTRFLHQIKVLAFPIQYIGSKYNFH